MLPASSSWGVDDVAATTPTPSFLERRLSPMRLFVEALPTTFFGNQPWDSTTAVKEGRSTLVCPHVHTAGHRRRSYPVSLHRRCGHPSFRHAPCAACAPAA